MSSRIVELVLFSAGLAVCLGLLVVAIRRAHTWIAAALVGVVGCIGTLVVNLHGYTMAGGGSYGVDHRIPRAQTTGGDVTLMVVSFLVPVAIYVGVRTWRSRR